MGKVFDCRYRKHIVNHEMITDDDYVAVIKSDSPPEYDDILISSSSDLFVIDHVEHFENDLYKVLLTAFGMGVSGNKTPSYRNLKRGVLSQFKREDRKIAKVQSKSHKTHC